MPDTGASVYAVNRGEQGFRVLVAIIGHCGRRASEKRPLVGQFESGGAEFDLLGTIPRHMMGYTPDGQFVARLLL